MLYGYGMGADNGGGTYSASVTLTDAQKAQLNRGSTPLDLDKVQDDLGVKVGPQLPPGYTPTSGVMSRPAGPEPALKPGEAWIPEWIKKGARADAETKSAGLKIIVGGIALVAGYLILKRLFGDR